MATLEDLLASRDSDLLSSSSGPSKSKTAQSRLRRRLYLKRLLRAKRQKLRPEDMERRVRCSHKLLNLLKNKPKGALVFASDEPLQPLNCSSFSDGSNHNRDRNKDEELD